MPFAIFNSHSMKIPQKKVCSVLLDNQSYCLRSVQDSQEINALFTTVKCTSATAEPKQEDDRPEQIKKIFSERAKELDRTPDKTFVMVKIFMGRRFKVKSFTERIVWLHL